MNVKKYQVDGLFAPSLRGEYTTIEYTSNFDSRPRFFHNHTSFFSYSVVNGLLNVLDMGRLFVKIFLLLLALENSTGVKYNNR